MDDEKLARFERAANRLAEAFPQNSSQSNITVNAGGVGVLIAGCCCSFMFAVILIGGHFYSQTIADLKADTAEIREDQRATKAYLQGIWQKAPHLKPEETK